MQCAVPHFMCTIFTIEHTTNHMLCHIVYHVMYHITDHVRYEHTFRSRHSISWQPYDIISQFPASPDTIWLHIIGSCNIMQCGMLQYVMWCECKMSYHRQDGRTKWNATYYYGKKWKITQYSRIWQHGIQHGIVRHRVTGDGTRQGHIAVFKAKAYSVT